MFSMSRLTGLAVAMLCAQRAATVRGAGRATGSDFCAQKISRATGCCRRHPDSRHCTKLQSTESKTKTKRPKLGGRAAKRAARAQFEPGTVNQLVPPAPAATTRMADLLNMSAPAYRERFQPRTREQYLVAVATLWNMLDRNIERKLKGCRRGPRCPGTPYGYMRPAQLEHYSSFVWDKGPQIYCEVGFNGGHGTVAMMLANSRLTVHSFELAGYLYTMPAMELVQDYFGERFHFYRGDSTKLVPAFARNASHSCDVLLVDGDHRFKGAFADIKSMRKLAKPGAVLLIDDLDGARAASNPHATRATRSG